MDQVTDHIWISNIKDANDLFGLNSNGITAVLNVAMQQDVTFKNVNWNVQFPIEYAKVGLTDGDRDAPRDLFAAALVLGMLLERHKYVLVNCHVGHSRSATIVACYLHFENGWDFYEAVNRLRKGRDGIKEKPAPYKAAEILCGDKKWSKMWDELKTVKRGW